MFDEYRRHQYAGLHQGNGRDRRYQPPLSSSPYAGGEGPGPGSAELFRPACLDPALAADRLAHSAEGMEAEPRRPAKARRPLRMHPVRLLLDGMPELLVELGTLSRPGGAPAGAPL